MATKHNAKGTQLRYNVDTTPVVVPSLGTITGPSLEGRQIETTTHDTSGNIVERAGTLVDPGDITADCMFDPTDSTHQVIFEDLLLAGTGAALRSWDVNWNQLATPWHLPFSGFVKSFPVTAGIEDVIRASLTIQVTAVSDIEVTP